MDQLEATYEKSYETIIGNCDTHVFLGSNSYKTVEYFSKALGEKTIERDSTSINRDRQHHRTGTSDSDQVMARALMTPDELRRLDNDLCIIFEKGIKPVKANKFYYFKHNNDIVEKERGTWRKFNPYNPWTEDKNVKEVQNLKVESLDDLFEEEPKQEEYKEKEPVVITTNQKTKTENKKEEILIDNIFDDIDLQKSTNKTSSTLTPIQDEEDTYDLQKELEAKFDELFGSIDDEE